MEHHFLRVPRRVPTLSGFGATWFIFCVWKRRAGGEPVVLLLSCPQHTGPSYFGKTRAGSVSASLTPPRRLGLEASYSVHCLSPFPLVSCTLRQVCKILPRNSLSPPKASGHSAQLIDTHFLSIPLVLQTSHCTVLLQTSPQGAISPSSRLPPSPAHSLLIS